MRGSTPTCRSSTCPPRRSASTSTGDSPSPRRRTSSASFRPRSKTATAHCPSPSSTSSPTRRRRSRCPPRRRLPRLPRRQVDRREADPRLRGAPGAPEPDPHGRLHRRSEGSEPAQRRRVSPGNPPGRCYLGGPSGSVKAHLLSARPARSRYRPHWMDMRLLRFLPVALLLAVLLVAAGCGGSKSVPSSAVAVVGDATITKTDFNNLLDGAKRT